MSVRINLDELTEDQKKLIRKYLCFQPKKTNFAVNKFSSVEKDPILFYWIDKPNNQIVLPYIFGNSLLGKHINSALVYPPGKFKFNAKLRDYQVPVAQEALKQLQERGTTMLSLYTGWGKSLLSIYLASELGGLTMILTNRETIQTGWIETIKKETDAVVWVIDSKMKIPEKCNIILTMDGRFEKIPWEIRKLVSVFVIDELHLFLTPSQVPVLLGVQPKYIIGCSATLQRPDGMEKMAISMLGHHKVEVKNDKKFTVYKLNTGIETEIVKNKQGTTDFAALTRELAFNPTRNAMIIDFVEQNKQLKFIILTWNKAHVSFLMDIFKKRGESVDMLAGTKSKYIDSRILIGTISKISTGFDAKNVAIDFQGISIDTIILTGSTKSHNLHIQSIGRAFRSDTPNIIDMVDNNHIAKSHWRERKKNYEELNCEIKEFNINGEIVPEKEEISQKDVESMHTSRVQAHQEKNNHKVLEDGDETSKMHALRLKALQEKMKK
jgi:superfamily II DNA or RNA helicase